MWFITMITDLEEFSTRTVGWYETKEVAENSVRENRCDLNETIYDYAVIEFVPKGLYANDNRGLWFKFNYETKKYEDIDCPKDFLNIVGIGIG